MAQQTIAAGWITLRDALSKNDPITLPEEKVRTGNTFTNYPPPGSQIQTAPITKTLEELKLSLNGFLKGNVLTFKSTMTQMQTCHAVMLWASVLKTNTGKRKINEEKYEVSIANVFKIFNMADLEIRKIHESNGTPVSD